MSNMLVLTTDFIQRTDDGGGAIDNVILTLGNICVLSVDDEEGKKHYLPWVVEGTSVEDAVEGHNQSVLSSRNNHYKRLSDPLFLEYRYDQTEEKKQQWLDKVKEIKSDLPLIEL